MVGVLVALGLTTFETVFQSVSSFSETDGAKKRDMTGNRKKCQNNTYSHLMQVQQALVLLLFKQAGRLGTEGFPAPSPDRNLSLMNHAAKPKEICILPPRTSHWQLTLDLKFYFLLNTGKVLHALFVCWFIVFTIYCFVERALPCIRRDYIHNLIILSCYLYRYLFIF